MPYITSEFREKLDPAIYALAMELKNLYHDNLVATDWLGQMNYAITKLLVTFTHDMHSYATICAVDGILANVGREYYRRIAVPYENDKKNENGEVFV